MRQEIWVALVAAAVGAVAMLGALVATNHTHKPLAPVTVGYEACVVDHFDAKGRPLSCTWQHVTSQLDNESSRPLG